MERLEHAGGPAPALSRPTGPRIVPWVFGLALGLLVPPVQAATPPPLIGTRGPLWFGAVTPGTPEILARGRGLIQVDPVDGTLWLQVTEASLAGPGPEAGVLREYRDGRWHWSLDERAIEVRRGLTLTTLGGQQVFEAAAPLAKELETWPVGTRLSLDGVDAERLPDGWQVRDGELTTQYDRQGWPAWRRDRSGSRVIWERKDGQLHEIRREGGEQLQVQFDGQGRLSVLKPPTGVERYFEHTDGLLVRAGPLRQEVRYTHDDDGRVASITWADLSRVQVSRSATHQVTSLVGPGPRRATYTWSQDGVEARTGSGAPTRITWTAEGYTVRDPAGTTVRVQTADGRLTGWEDPAGSAVRLSRDSSGRIIGVAGAATWRLRWRGDDLSEVVDPSGAQWQASRTGAGDLQQLVDPDGRKLGLAWDARSVLRAVDAGTMPTRLSWDDRGRLTEIQAPSGAVTRLTWSVHRLDATDPAGQALSLTGMGEQTTVLKSRLEETWTVTRDALGRPTRVALPDGRTLTLERNSLGRLGAMSLGENQHVRYGWSSDGHPTRVTDPVGGATGLDYDISRRLAALSRPDGSAVKATRDVRGELTGVAAGDERWALTRDGQGHPLSLGPLTWAWDVAGQWLGWAARGVELLLARTGAGHVREVRWTGGERLGVDRDAAGRVSRVRTAAGTWTLAREPGGAVRKLTGPGVDKVELQRDDRGLITLLTWGDARRRVMRDAAGRPVKWTASGGAALSVNRGTDGRPALGRFPSGALARWAWQAAGGVLELVDPGGQVLLTRALALDARGRTARVTEGGVDTVWRRDPLGEVAAVETADGAWSWLPGRLEGPAGHVVLLDEHDRPTLSIPPVGPTAWGLTQDRLAYLLDEHGRVVGLTGDEGQLLEVEHDPAGLPVALVRDDGERWQLTWDPFGRLIGATDPEGEVTRLGQGPEGLLGWSRGDTRTELLPAAGMGWVEATGAEQREVLSDETGSPRLVLAPDQEPRRITWGPTGMPDQATGTPLGWRGAWSLFPGGPLLDGAGGLDPVSGMRTDPGWRPPWWASDRDAAPWPALDTAASPWWDPGPWQARSVWSDPLGLLLALGELSPLLDPSTPGLPTAAPPLPWLPESAAAPPPPLVRPDPGAPAADPLVALMVEAATAPTEPLTTAAVLQAVLAPEWEGLPRLEGLVAEPEVWWTAGLEELLRAP